MVLWGRCGTLATPTHGWSEGKENPMKLRVWMVSVAVALGVFGCDDKAQTADAKQAKAQAKGSAKTDSSAKAPGTDDAKATADTKTDAKADTKADAEAPVQINVDEQGRALRGFDPLAYREGQPVEGKPEHTFEWNGAKWQFASAQNMKTFSESPDEHAPANGGYCTFGVVLGKKFDGDPNVWLTKDDVTYVFLNEEVKAKFLEDEAGNLSKVKENWPKIKDRSADELGG